MAHLIEHRGFKPEVHPSAYLAPTAVLCGQVTLGPDSRVLFGAVLTAEGGPVTVGRECVVMENAVLRGTKRHPLTIGDHVLIGPRSYLTGCTVEDSCFLATGATIFNGAKVGRGSEVRINGLIHLKTVIPAGTMIPIGWVAVGDPARILPPDRHQEIYEVQQPLNFPMEVFGLERAPTEEFMPRMTRRYTAFLAGHKEDRILNE
jgi:carbonic anhydrase/acetyltransferase-like protein (isoleucine patch superfamily)